MQGKRKNKAPLKGESLVEFSGFLEVDLIEAIPAKEFHHGKDFFVDTLSAVGTDATVKLIVKLLLNKDVTGLKAKLLPASFSFGTKPSKETVAAIVPLLKRDNSASVTLGVSSLIHRFCSLKNCDNISSVQEVVSVFKQLFSLKDCDNISSVQEVVSVFNNYLGHKCSSNEKISLKDCDNISSVQEVVSVFNNYLGHKCSSNEKDKVLKACKAFGNMGYHGKARDNIIECIKDRSKSNRLRLAAIDSFRESTSLLRPRRFFNFDHFIKKTFSIELPYKNPLSYKTGHLLMALSDTKIIIMGWTPCINGQARNLNT
ncbi:vitellogenin [Caerostris extrusa]|uniref:Vitellogenin n=1 Tax=Caerostris extrusa TaxID=172846 RepID=A0AAV4S8R0_CAEEX|nr:vitellogenin [Caerostris extrusa]